MLGTRRRLRMRDLLLLRWKVEYRRRLRNLLPVGRGDRSRSGRLSIVGDLVQDLLLVRGSNGCCIVRSWMY